jgi:Nucleotide modification associated domain 2
MKYCFYTMTHDTGFAPNPYHRYCTLAACTPNHQRARIHEGDVIVGLEGGELTKKRLRKGVSKYTGSAIIYYMKVGEILSLNEYFNDKRFAEKKARPNGTYIESVGDNVYFVKKKRWSWIAGHAHDDSATTGCKGKGTLGGVIAQDIKGDRVFISQDFYYFGDLGINCPDSVRDFANPRGIKYFHGPYGELDKHISRVAKRFGKKGRLGNPIEAGAVKGCR